MSDKKTLLCYNRGCGQKFDPNDNKDGDCVHHPGQPVFHDAYKGWSCCNKKCTDFTEFLNIKGCTKSCHTNEKPPEPEKPPVDKSKADEIIEVKLQPISNGSTLQRPPFDSPLITLKPVVSPVLLQQIQGLASNKVAESEQTKIPIGESCKNKGCKATYEGLASNEGVCSHHPGVPIFHEGLKFWSCCTKRTTDFSVFLEQPGCTQGTHLWASGNTSTAVRCRMDWHQTGGYVVVSVFAKKYQPSQSSVKLNPIRLAVELFFQEENSTFKLDVELRGVVDVEQSSVNMLPTKVEIKLKKAEPGSWATLDALRATNNWSQPQPTPENDDSINSQVDAVNLNDL